MPGAAPAEVRAEHRVRYYDVSALDAAGLQDQMQRRGPRGFWAHTTWHVTWSARCEVTLDTRIVFPRHVAPQRLPDALRRDWAAMTRALMQHEMQHRAFGIAAAAEIERTACRNADAVIERWAAEDVRLDRLTDHGRTTGVTLD